MRTPMPVTTPRTVSPVDDEVGDRLLEQREPGRALQHPADVAAVERTVDLGAGRPHRGALAGVEGAEVDPAVVRAHRHRPAERVDLLDEVPLADPPDGRVAAHLPQRLDALGKQQRLRPRPRRGERRLGAGMAAADDDDVECPVVEHGMEGRFRVVRSFGTTIVAGFSLDSLPTAGPRIPRFRDGRPAKPAASAT